jgi:hypothetical protein
LRCTIALTLLAGSFRDFAARLADSPLLQWFCRVGQLERVKVPAKAHYNFMRPGCLKKRCARSSMGCCAKQGQRQRMASRCWNWRSPLDLSTTAKTQKPARRREDSLAFVNRGQRQVPVARPVLANTVIERVGIDLEKG